MSINGWQELRDIKGFIKTDLWNVLKCEILKKKRAEAAFLKNSITGRYLSCWISKAQKSLCARKI